jgi:hypothetical protein
LSAGASVAAQPEGAINSWLSGLATRALIAFAGRAAFSLRSTKSAYLVAAAVTADRAAAITACAVISIITRALRATPAGDEDAIFELVTALSYV